MNSPEVRDGFYEVFDLTNIRVENCEPYEGDDDRVKIGLGQRCASEHGGKKMNAEAYLYQQMREGKHQQFNQWTLAAIRHMCEFADEFRAATTTSDSVAPST